LTNQHHHQKHISFLVWLFSSISSWFSRSVQKALLKCNVDVYSSLQLPGFIVRWQRTEHSAICISRG